MAEALDWVTGVLLLLGAFLALTGAVGILRMPDFFTRLHPAGKSDTMAQSCFLIGLMLQAEFSPEGAKLFLIWLFLLMSTPTATHAITQAAHLAGLVPWQKTEDRSGASE